jgi:hypothetical protein
MVNKRERERGREREGGRSHPILLPFFSPSLSLSSPDNALFYERQAQLRAEEQAKLLAEKEELEANLASISIDEDPDLIREHQVTLGYFFFGFGYCVLFWSPFFYCRVMIFNLLRYF